MNNFSPLIAMIAVAISIATFLAAGRREKKSWQRDARLQLYAEIVDSVYARLDGAYYALADRTAGRDEEFSRRKEEEGRQHALQMKLLYKLRLLGDSPTMRSAIEIHRNNHLMTDLAFSSDTVPVESEMDRYRDAARANEVAISRFYDATRRSFALRRLMDQNETFWRFGDPTQH